MCYLCLIIFMFVCNKLPWLIVSCPLKKNFFFQRKKFCIVRSNFVCFSYMSPEKGNGNRGLNVVVINGNIKTQTY